jgi:hypothetical protein
MDEEKHLLSECDPESEQEANKLVCSQRSRRRTLSSSYFAIVLSLLLVASVIANLVQFLQPHTCSQLSTCKLSVSTHSHDTNPIPSPRTSEPKAADQNTPRRTQCKKQRLPGCSQQRDLNSVDSPPPTSVTLNPHIRPQPKKTPHKKQHSTSTRHSPNSPPPPFPPQQLSASNKAAT